MCNYLETWHSSMFLHFADVDTFPIKDVDSLGNIVDNYSWYFNSFFIFCQKKNSFTQNFITYIVCMWNRNCGVFGIQCKVLHWTLSIVLGSFLVNLVFYSGVTKNNILCTKKKRNFPLRTSYIDSNKFSVSYRSAHIYQRNGFLCSHFFSVFNPLVLDVH